MSFIDGLQKRSDSEELQEIRVPEWIGLDGVGPHGEVYVKSLTLSQTAIARKYGKDRGDELFSSAKLLQFALRDEAGNHLIRGQQECEQFAKVLDVEVAGRVLKLIGANDDLEETEKNSGKTANDD